MVSATDPTDVVGEAYDVIVVGGGPAGTTTASLVAEKGYDVLLLEREAESRFQIGESLVPATYWTLQRLGMVEKLKASGSPKKYSVQFFGGSGKASAPDSATGGALQPASTHAASATPSSLPLRTIAAARRRA